MAFNIDEFVSQGLPNEAARPNLFEIQVVNPVDPSGDRQLTFTAKTSQLPPASLGTLIVPYFGRQIKFKGDRIFPEWTITVINDSEFVTRNAFERWMDAINGHRSNLQSSFNYKSDLYIRQFSRDGSVSKEYTMVGTFPVDLSPIDVSWESNDIAEEYTVSFQYQYWESNTTN